METMTVKERQQEKSYLDYVAERDLKRVNEIKEKKVIKKFANHYGYSDVNPYEVIRKVSDQTVEIREMETKQIVFPSNFQSGGFSAHCVDNHNQDYEYISDDKFPIKRIRWSKAKNNWYHHGMLFLMEVGPYKHYDYNF